VFVPTFINGFVVGESIGILENQPQTIKVYPNPVSDFVTVKSDFAINSIEVISYLGQSVYIGTYNGDMEVQVKVSGLPSGMYFVKVWTDKGVGMVKVAVGR
jgi:hypothetical protein